MVALPRKEARVTSRSHLSAPAQILFAVSSAAALRTGTLIVSMMRGAILDRYAYPPLLSLAVLLGFIVVLTWLATRVFAAGEDT